MELKKTVWSSFESHFFETSKLNLYSSIKKVYRTEPYLLSNLSFEEKKAVTKCRISAHCFPIEFYRRHVDRQNRSCKLCIEFHYITKCNNLVIQAERSELYAKLQIVNSNILDLPDISRDMICAQDIDTLSSVAKY